MSRLHTAMPFDGHGIMRYFSGHAIPGIESGDSSTYRRLIRDAKGNPVELAVVLDGEDGVLASVDGRALTPQGVRDARHLFDLDANSPTIDAHLSRDAALADSVAMHPGVRLPGSLDVHEQLFRTMIGQQVSIAAARTTVARIARELDGSGLFPTATSIAENGLEVLRGPAGRVAAIHGAALAIATGALVLSTALSVEELTERLCAMPGIGPWTAGYVAMRALGAPDVLLANDLVLLKGAAKLGLPATARGIAEYALRWQPYRSYASLHLWRIAQQQ